MPTPRLSLAPPLSYPLLLIECTDEERDSQVPSSRWLLGRTWGVKRMGYRILNVDFAQPLPEFALADDEDGLAVVARWHGELIGFEMLPRGDVLATPEQRRQSLLESAFGLAILKRKVRQELEKDLPPPRSHPSVTVAICTKDRSERLSRLLGSLSELDTPPPGTTPLDVLVVDNAPSDNTTRGVVEQRAEVRYVVEPKPGLDFARNTALANARGDLLAFLDDDVTVDPGWLNGLYAAAANNPDAGGFTGLVMPFALATDAQVLFESHGGFGRGFDRLLHRQEKMKSPLFPLGAGGIGAGCNMAFRRDLLNELGGFDNALDTGRPLPGGGDLDIFYRVLRSGNPMAYEPSYAVYHEHRQTMAQLRHQYMTWGLGFMAYLTKCRRTDPELRRQQSEITRWWFVKHAAQVVRALFGRSSMPTSHVFAQLKGGVIGVFGEYDRSRRRIARIEKAFR